MKDNQTFLCVGSATQDVFLSNTPEFAPVCESPEQCFFEIPLGSKINVNKIDFSTGGGATNAATTFARNGQHAIFMGQIGHDPAGDAVLRMLDEEAIDSSYVSYSPKSSTGYSVLLLAPDGERTILTYRGASTHFNPKNFDLDQVQADWLYVTTLNGHFEILDKLFDSAKEKGIKIAFNPGKSELTNPQKLKPLLADVEILLLNKEEAQMIATGETAEELLRHARNFCRVVVITDGQNGSWAADKTSVLKSGIYEPEQISLDRTGAGDAFGSGFVLKYASGSGLKEAIHFASANAASVVMQIGTKTGILRAQNHLDLHEMEIDVKPANY